ncbi:MAG: extracellular solute-binding protein, partial [Candidatus Latescibacteria bacterium]|nr:extracellular solute-binding protein [Candidatus Latescibacterota bacterium]
GGGGAQAPKDVAMGEVAYGLSIDFYAWAQVAEVGEAFVGFTMPDNLTIVNPDALAIVKGAPNPDVARAFVRFAMSEPGQKLWFLKQGAPGGPVKSQLNRFTVIPDLYTRHRETAAVALNPFDWTSDLVYDSDLGSTRRSVLNDLIGVLIIDSHNQLQLAWERARAGGVTQEEVRRLSAVPITLEECLKLASSWRDAALRNRRLAEWTAFTRDKYGDPEEHPATRVLDFLTLFFPFGIAGAMVLYVWRTRGL